MSEKFFNKKKIIFKNSSFKTSGFCLGLIIIFVFEIIIITSIVFYFSFPDLFTKIAKNEFLAITLSLLVVGLILIILAIVLWFFSKKKKNKSKGFY